MLEQALAAVEQVNQPCRMEKVLYDRDLPVYIDVCHNESGLQSVLNELKLTHPGKSLRVACAFSKAKEIQKMIAMLLEQTKAIHFLACPHFKLESISNLYELA